MSFDGLTVLHLSNAGGLPEVWAVPVAAGESRRLLPAGERVGSAQASPTQPRAVVAVDSGGDEHWKLALLDWAGTARGQLVALTSDPKVIHQPGRWDADGRRYRYSSNRRDPHWFDVHELDVDHPGASRPMLVADGHHSVRASLGSQTLVQRANTNLDGDLILLDGERTVQLTPHDGELSIFSAGLRPDGVYAAANPGREFAALVRYRTAGGSHEFLREFPGDLEIVEPSPIGDLLALVINREGWSETRLFDVATREERILNSGPKGVIGSISWLPDGSAFVYDLSSVEGVDLFRRTIATGKEKRLTGGPSSVPRPIPPPKIARMRASDGVSIPYWEYPPASPSDLGTLVWVHGGPEGQARPGFSAVQGFLISEGWRIIAPNIRGSTGYGRTYVHLDDVRLRMNSVRDVHELALQLIRLGKARAGRLGIVGGSYGGFVVLSAASTYPGAWGAAVDLVGIANFVTFLERTGAWRRKLREDEYGSLANDRAFLEEISPLHHADRIRAPLLVIHGRNDPRVPLHEAEQIVASLKKLGRPVELLVFDDEGHGIVRRENQLAAWSKASEFLAAHLSGPAPAPGPAARPGPGTRRLRKAPTP